MIKILIIFILVIFLLVLLITAAVISRSKNKDNISFTQYLDEDGNHLYYNHRIIRNKQQKNKHDNIR